MVRSISLLLLGASLLGCAGSPVDARTARDALADALEAHDAAALSRFTDGPVTVEGASDELAAEGRALRSAPLLERARIYLVSGAVVLLVREEDGWRVDRGLFGVPVAATPSDALAAFAQALRRVRGTHVTAVLSRRTRLLVADELERWLSGLGDLSALPIVIEADHATATLPTGVVVELVLEAGEWRIEDVHE